MDRVQKVFHMQGRSGQPNLFREGKLARVIFTYYLQNNSKDDRLTAYMFAL